VPRASAPCNCGRASRAGLWPRWECAAAGLFISAGPSILHDDAQAQVAAGHAGEWLLVETDSPVE
jgi:hypothetical protein